ncbi:septation protein A [uncultured Vibrio sp.]|uniref:septation protein A n=1 Tax=uncultured Vibrio sp. TaxID=114054 RepID=UPI002AA7AAC3|nr:septation protein A [uncultured Vibrio sp.]
MKFFIDFFPVLLFFLAYKLVDIYVATAVAIGATFLQIGYTWWKTKKLVPMQLITLAVIVVFGGMTLYLRDEQFIKWKPTVINWLFAVVFFLSQFIGKRTAIERMLGTSIVLPQPVWHRLNGGWTLFFLFLGTANLYVMRYFDSNTWVNFKLFGMLGLTLVFVILQSIYLARYVQDTDGEKQ